MHTRIKICGITRLDDAALAVELGAAALGFNFYPPSPRYVAPERAQEIISLVPPPVMTVGVFADGRDSDDVLSVAQAAGVNTIQLHGIGAGLLPARLSPMGRVSGRGAAKPAKGRPRAPSLSDYPLIRAIAVDDSFEPAS